MLTPLRFWGIKILIGRNWHKPTSLFINEVVLSFLTVLNLAKVFSVFKISLEDCGRFFPWRRRGFGIELQTDLDQFDLWCHIHDGILQFPKSLVPRTGFPELTEAKPLRGVKISISRFCLNFPFGMYSRAWKALSSRDSVLVRGPLLLLKKLRLCYVDIVMLMLKH